MRMEGRRMREHEDKEEGGGKRNACGRTAREKTKRKYTEGKRIKDGKK